MNHKKTQRLWREEAFRVPQRPLRKRRDASTSDTPVTAAYRNHVCVIDFQHDHLQDGSGFNIASILDEHTRVILDDTVDTSITGEDLAANLDSITLEDGFPEFLRMDNGPEMIARRDR